MSDHAARFFSLLADAARRVGMDRPGFELRAPHAVQWGRALGTASGYFDNPRDFSRAVATLDGLAPGVYVTLNPGRPELRANAPNRLRRNATTTTTDADVVRRIALLVDLDVVRPSGTSTTDAEHQEALDRALAVRAFLVGLGWPAPVLVDSGNCSQVLAGLDLPNDEPSRDLARDLLKALAARFSDDAVAVDLAVYNAARISKIPGTWARKGVRTDVRPHRRAALLEVPDRLEPVPVELLRALAAEVRTERPRLAPAWTPPPSSADLHTVVARARRYVAHMPAAISGQGGHAATFRVALTLVQGFALPEDAALVLLAEYSERCDPPWTERELRHKVRQAAERARVPSGYLLAGRPA